MSVSFAGAADGNEIERLAFDCDVGGLFERLGVDGMQEALQRVRHDDAFAGNSDARRGSLQWPSML